MPAVPSASAEAGPPGPELAIASGEGDRWRYEGPTGPEHWAGLREEWFACGEAEGQSPVDLPLDALTQGSPEPTGPEEKASPGVLANLGDLPLVATNDGQLVRLLGSSSQLIRVDGHPAELEEIEVHTPAEHQLGGIAFDLELTLWFKQADQRLALSLLFRQGQPSSALAPLIENLPPQGSYAKTPLRATLPLGQLMSPSQKLLAYSGSETTPPCTPGVRRLVLASVGELSPEQLASLRGAAGTPSARPLQALGGRTVTAMSLETTTSASSVDSPP